MEKCYCGLPLHYQDKNIEAEMIKLVKEEGSHVPVVAGGHTFMVPRHFIALHGIKSETLKFMGFEEINK
jgi:hypothetical protein